jgi:hypothetical protein
MKKYFLLLVFAALITVNAHTQDSLFVGTWKIENTKHKLSIPTTIQIEMVNDSLVLIPKTNGDITRLVKYDSTSMVIEHIMLNTKTKKYESTEYRFSMNEKNNSIDVVVKTKDEKDPFVLKYAFQMVCCANHHPTHCASSAADRQKMKDLGCTGLHGK